MSELIKQNRNFSLFVALSLVLHLSVLIIILIINPTPTKAKLQTRQSVQVGLKFAVKPSLLPQLPKGEEAKPVATKPETPQPKVTTPPKTQSQPKEKEKPVPEPPKPKLKPTPKTQTKKAAPKPEPIKEQPKPVKKPEPTKEQPKPAKKPEPQKEPPKPTKKVVQKPAPPSKTVTKTPVLAQKKVAVAPSTAAIAKPTISSVPLPKLEPKLKPTVTQAPPLNKKITITPDGPKKLLKPTKLKAPELSVSKIPAIKPTPLVKSTPIEITPSTTQTPPAINLVQTPKVAPPKPELKAPVSPSPLKMPDIKATLPERPRLSERPVLANRPIDIPTIQPEVTPVQSTLIEPERFEVQPIQPQNVAIQPPVLKNDLKIEAIKPKIVKPSIAPVQSPETLAAIKPAPLELNKLPTPERVKVTPIKSENLSIEKLTPTPIKLTTPETVSLEPIKTQKLPDVEIPKIKSIPLPQETLSTKDLTVNLDVSTPELSVVIPQLDTISVAAIDSPTVSDIPLQTGIPDGMNVEGGFSSPSINQLNLGKARYYALIKARLREVQATEHFEKGLKAVYKLKVDANGKLLELSLVESSGLRAWDFVARTNILSIELPSLPEDIPAPYSYTIQMHP